MSRYFSGHFASDAVGSSSMPQDRAQRHPELFSIASVSEQTGIGIETLRLWERRYGEPKPVRLPSGHRRFTPVQIEWLRKVADAIAMGHRPSRVITMSDSELTAVLGAACTAPATDTAMERLLDLARRFAEPELVRALKADARRQGVQDFVLRRAVPLLEAVGQHWSSGDLAIRHEHFLTEILQDVLRDLRRRAVVRKTAPLVLAATLSGERHGLGLLAASLLMSSAGLRVHLLGPDIPVAEILDAVRERESDPAAIAISVSLATNSVTTAKLISDLRASLPATTRLIAGGKGARRLRRGVRDVDYFPDLAQFRSWLDTKPFAVNRKA